MGGSVSFAYHSLSCFMLLLYLLPGCLSSCWDHHGWILLASLGYHRFYATYTTPRSPPPFWVPTACHCGVPALPTMEVPLLLDSTATCSSVPTYHVLESWVPLPFLPHTWSPTFLPWEGPLGHSYLHTTATGGSLLGAMGHLCLPHLPTF